MIVYKTTNLINGKVYVGKSKFNKKNYYGSGILLKRAISKYGKENFVKEILEICINEQQLNEKEIKWIAKINCIQPNGYNISLGGTGGNTLTNHPNIEEIRKKLKNKIPTKHSKEWIEYLKNTRKGVGNPFFGKKHSNEKKHLMGHLKGKKIPKHIIEKSTYMLVVEFVDAHGIKHVCTGIKQTRKKIQELEHGVNKWHKCCWEKLRDFEEYRGYKLIRKKKKSILELKKQNLI